jgi:hypothetical protein
MTPTSHLIIPIQERPPPIDRHAPVGTDSHVPCIQRPLRVQQTKLLERLLDDVQPTAGIGDVDRPGLVLLEHAELEYFAPELVERRAASVVIGITGISVVGGAEGPAANGVSSVGRRGRTARHEACANTGVGARTGLGGESFVDGREVDSPTGGERQLLGRSVRMYTS